MKGITQRSSWSLRLSLLVYGAGVLAYRESIMDDTYIHLQYARNLWQHGEISFNTGEPSLGLTSPLWVMILAVFRDGIMSSRLASVAFGALSVWLFHRLARRFFSSPAFSTAASIAWAGSLWFVRHAPNGMEATCAVFWVLSAVSLRARVSPGRWGEVLFGVTLAAAVLTRPELVLLPLVYFVVDFLQRPQRSRIWYWAAPGVLLMAAWFTFSLLQTGQAIPDTGTAKSGGLAWTPEAWLRVTWRELRILASDQAVEWLGIVLATVVLFRLRGRGVWREWSKHTLFPYALFSLALLVGFAFSDVQIQPRYLLPTLPCWTLLGFLAWQNLFGARARVAGWVAAASLTMTIVSSLLVVHPSTIAFSRTLRTAIVPLADEILRLAGSQTVVATPDIGLLGYRTQARILDLGGLIEPGIQILVQEIGYDEMLSSGRFQSFGPAEFVVDRTRTPERFRGHVTNGREWIPLRTTRLANLGISRPGPFFYTLYRLEKPKATPGSSNQP